MAGSVAGLEAAGGFGRGGIESGQGAEGPVFRWGNPLDLMHPLGSAVGRIKDDVVIPVAEVGVTLLFYGVQRAFNYKLTGWADLIILTAAIPIFAYGDKILPRLFP